MELAQPGARLQPELVAQQRAELAVGLERLGLPTAAIEREHQQLPGPLAVRLRQRERTRVPADGLVVSEVELGGEALLEGRDAKLLETARLRLRERGVRHVGERRTAPEPEGALQARQRQVGVARGAGRRGVRDQALEAGCVEIVGSERERVAAGARLDRPGADPAPQLRDVDGEQVPGRRGRGGPPDRVDQPVARHRPPGAQQQADQQRALLCSRRRGGAPVDRDLERAEDRYPDRRSPRGAAGTRSERNRANADHARPGGSARASTAVVSAWTARGMTAATVLHLGGPRAWRRNSLRNPLHHPARHHRAGRHRRSDGDSQDPVRRRGTARDRRAVPRARRLGSPSGRRPGSARRARLAPERRRTDPRSTGSRGRRGRRRTP